MKKYYRVIYLPNDSDSEELYPLSRGLDYAMAMAEAAVTKEVSQGHKLDGYAIHDAKGRLVAQRYLPFV